MKTIITDVSYVYSSEVWPLGQLMLSCPMISPGKLNSSRSICSNDVISVILDLLMISLFHFK